MILKQLLKQRSELEAELDYLQSFIETSPNGKLISRAKSDGSFRYSVKTDSETGNGQEVYISKKDRSLAESLALKQYAAERMKDAIAEKRSVDAQIRLLEKESHAEHFLKTHLGPANLIVPRLKDNDSFSEEWEKAPYTRSSLNPQDLKYPTVIPDLFVRSKAEADIVYAFVHHKVPFRYEEELVINQIKLHPDFTCLNKRTRQIFYLEHQGKWDDPAYVESVRWRENLYLQAGIYPWKQLLITTETLDQPFDIRWFHQIVEYYLL